MTATARSPSATDPGQLRPAAIRRRPGLGAVAVAVETVAFAVLLSADGTPGWRVARAAIGLMVGAAAVVVELRGRPMARACVALGLALAGLTAGVGIGVLHVVKSDVTVAAAAALAVLAAGLLLTGLAVHRLWRATARWWRLLGLPLAFVLVEFVLIPFTAAIYATNVPASELANTTPADHGLTYQDVTLTTGDGVRLAAWYIPSRNGAALVALHGAGSTRSGVLDQAAVIARHGYGVLLLDARGHGRSAGTAMDNGWWGDQDIAAAVRWLQLRPDVRDRRIGALGLSMGGEEAIGAAAHNRGLHAVVAEGALWRGAMDTAWLPTDLEGYIERGMLAVQTAVSAVLTDAPRPISLERALIEAAPTPVLLIAGQPELRGDRYLRDHSPGNVQLWELPGTPHTRGLAQHPAAWEQRVIRFLDQALAPTR